MILAPECRDCIINRTEGILQRSGTSQAEYMKILNMVEQKLDGVIHAGDSWMGEKMAPAQLGSVRQSVLRDHGLNDPYSWEKGDGTEIGSKIYEKYHQRDLSLEELLLVALLGNGLEYDVGGKYSPFNLQTFVRLIEETQYFNVENLTFIADEIQNMSSKQLVYLLDNVGEHYCDALLIEWLKNQGWDICVVVKGGPVLNDVTIKEMEEFPVPVKIMTTGRDDVGVFLSRIPKNVLSTLLGADLIIIKGMANFETLSREILPVPALYLLKAKCEPVARLLGIKKGEYFAYLLERDTALLDRLSQD